MLTARCGAAAAGGSAAGLLRVARQGARALAPPAQQRQQQRQARPPPPQRRSVAAMAAAAAAAEGAVKTVLVPVGNGSEEMEAVIVIDVLRRAGAHVVVASVEDSLEVTCSRGVRLVADALIGDAAAAAGAGGAGFDLIALPGGMPGAERLRDSAPLGALVAAQRDGGRRLAAICATPAVFLEARGLLRGAAATAHPAFADRLSNQAAVEDRVVVDDLLTTSRGPGTAFEFALSLVEQLFGADKAAEVAGPMVMPPAPARNPHAMLGLLGTVAGATALEIKRLRRRGSLEELKAIKAKERELRQLLEATNDELERVKLHSEAADAKAAELEARTAALAGEKAALEARTSELGAQKEALAQNNSKLVITNLMLMHRAKATEEHSRALIAKQEDLQHQLEQLQRDAAAAEAGFESSLAALKDQVTGVLGRYFSRDIDLAAALAEMAGLGIEVVGMDDLARQPGEGMEFETKLVLDSPHRMQRLMSAAAARAPQLGGLPHDSDVPRLAGMSFPMGITRDPATGAPRITLAWRTPEAQSAGALPLSGGGAADSQQAGSDQQPHARQQAAAKAIKEAPAAKAPAAAAAAAGGAAALTFAPSPSKAQQQHKGGGFSLTFGGFGIRAGGSGGGGASSSGGGAAPSLKHDADDDVFVGRELALGRRPPPPPATPSAMSSLLGRRAGQAAAPARGAAPACPARPRRAVRARSTAPGFEKAMFGEDFGARDPTPGEIGSNFGEKIVMNWDTEHIIKPPDAIGEHVGLTSRPCRADAELLDETRRERYRQQVPGWRIQATPAGAQCIRQEWTARDAGAAKQLVEQLQGIAAQHGHALSSCEAVSSTVVAELTTAAQGGLTENDFIVAAHINAADLKPLLAARKARYWA
ncbi:DJ1B [Scenedesmus sp. PABB004]|nr:DJ1B [Scenedesmus sp. PABB004]